MKLYGIPWVECAGAVKVPVLVIHLGHPNIVMHLRTIHSLSHAGSYPNAGVEGCEKKGWDASYGKNDKREINTLPEGQNAVDLIRGPSADARLRWTRGLTLAWCIQKMGSKAA